MLLGEIIKKYRYEHHMSMDEFSRRSGMSKAYISILEKNYNPKTKKPVAPSIDSIRKSANAMSISFDELFSLIESDVIINDAPASRIPQRLLDKLERFDAAELQKVEEMVDILLDLQKKEDTTSKMA